MNGIIRNSLLTAILLLSAAMSHAETSYDAPGAGNPIIPGYFADPTVKKFGDTYYIYATTDGNGGGFGPSQVWTSKDFVNWTLLPMNWPVTHHIWAPDVMQHSDGKYYMFYCEPCQIYAGVGETPRGPWKNVLGEEGKILVPDRFVTNAITLDGQTFTDDDGKVYLYWGTWGIYKGFGCGTGRLLDNMCGFDSTRLIVNTEAHEFFEAPFVIKKDGTYYFTYSAGSCHDETYRVQYATSTFGPMGPYETANNNPILATSYDKTVHGPGHHSILQEGDNYYIIYHRHNIPQASRGMHRQIAADKLEFGSDNTIKPVGGTHKGIGYLAENSNPFENLAYKKPVTASSWYSEAFKPKYAVDDNNATLWRPRTCGNEFLTIDLESEQHVERIWTQFEYATSYYQYLIEYSTDGVVWKIFADKRDNRLAGSPMTDYGDVTARYIRLTVTGNEKNGLSGGIWNIKVFSGSKTDPPQRLAAISSADIAATMSKGKVTGLSNRYGMLSGKWKVKGKLSVGNEKGLAYLNMQPGCMLSLPQARYTTTSAYTLTYRIYGTASQALQPVVSWNIEQDTYDASIETRDMPSWHEIALVSDGQDVNRYLDGSLISTRPAKHSENGSSLTISSGKNPIQLTDFSFYNWALEPAETDHLFRNAIIAPKPATDEARNHTLISVNADEFELGSTLSEIGEFKAEGASVDVVLKNGRKALAFDGTQQFILRKKLPSTMNGNAPYSIEAWILNPVMDTEEAILDLIEGGNELGSIVFGNGFNEDDGLMDHAGSFENTGLHPAVSKALMGKSLWKHCVITFDGYTERYYLNGKLWRENDMVLILNPDDVISLGSRRNGDYAFKGYLHSIAAYDYVISDAQILSGYRNAGKTDVLIDFHAADITSSIWNNEGLWGGTLIFSDQPTLQAGRKGMPSDITFKPTTNSPIIKSYRITFCLKEESQSAILDLNGTRLSLPSLRHGQWHEAILQKEDVWKFYVDGQLKTALERVPEESGNFHLALVNNDAADDHPIAYISDFVLYRSALSAQKIKESFQHLYESPFNSRSLTVEAKPISTNLARIFVAEGGKQAGETSWRYSYNGSDWVKTSEILLPIPAPGMDVQVEIQDAYGNIEALPVVQLAVSESDFIHKQDVYTLDKWDELVLGSKAEPYYEAGFSPHTVMLGSSNANFTQNPDENGPLLCHLVTGDFLMEVKVPFLFGQQMHTTPAYNEGGLMVLHNNDDATQDILQLGIFPLYDCGNMLTEVTRHGRFQTPNKLGWNYHPYLQIERDGNVFHFRTSPDGHNWTEMPNSPIERPEWNGQSVKAGIFQTTYTDNHATVTFEEYHLWQRK